MTDLIGKMVKNVPLALILLGIVTFTSGAADQLNLGGFLLQISNPNSKIIMEVIGLGLCIVGLIFVALDLSKNYRPNALPTNKSADTKSADTQKLYTFSGMNEETRDDDMFQDFEMSRGQPGGNINAVYYLWTDTLEGGQIHASINTKENFLRVSFENPQKAFASNIAIRSKNEKALLNSFHKSYLVFDARLSPNSPNVLQAEVSIAIRIVNGYHQHWKYVNGDNHFIPSRVTSTEWQTFFIHLESRNWSLFGSDGNHLFGPKIADFDIISYVVFELGTYHVLSPGAGSIDIRRIRLASERN